VERDERAEREAAQVVALELLGGGERLRPAGAVQRPQVGRIAAERLELRRPRLRPRADAVEPDRG
jgi:hypothetical protein